MEINKQMLEVQSFPSRVVIELTPLCNLACRMCPRHYVKDTEGYMDEDLFTKLVEEIARERPDAVLLPFWRGESCTHPDFVKLVSYALDQNLRVHLSTNGHYMAPQFVDVFQRCEFLTFSLHTNKGYDNALRFVREKPAISAVKTQISFIDVEQSTRKYLAECVADPNLMGFDGVRLYVEHTVGGAFGKSRLMPGVQRTFCSKLENTFVVSADGGYSRCNHIWTPETIPNLSKSTISEMWAGERMCQIRADYPDTQCQPCDQWTGHTNGEAWRKTPEGKVKHLLFGTGAGTV